MPAKKISMDEKYMKEAIRQAKKAAALKEVPNRLRDRLRGGGSLEGAITAVQ